ncbi:MAG: UBP-type zinc finger domain-containing protein [Acidimicrobiia bacterium]|nr:UBP-type zinc finger domain-containing protein [Acidimicrobiia bacterium]
MRSSSFSEAVRRIVFQRSFGRRECSHLDLVELTSPVQSECAACVDEGTRTVHLRMCLICGEVACCESSPGRHAQRHSEQTGHPLIRSIEPGEQWVWCYPDRAYLGDVSG